MPDDTTFMRRALELSARAYGETSPNPMVGAVVVRDGAILGEAYHAASGQPHAEPLAIRDAIRNAVSGDDLTLYVNLEPCVHHGRTPPCVDAILESPVRRVVVALADPDERVRGRGIECLRQAGRRVEVGLLAADAAELNHVFLTRQRTRRPFVALKVALSADDGVAAAHGEPVSITRDAARQHVHRLRAGLDAILVGVETLRRDRPRLDRRLYHGPGRAPRRLVLDPDLRSDPEWLWPGEPRPMLFHRRGASGAGRLRGAAELVPLPEAADGLDLSALPGALARLEIASLLVEGGPRTHRGFLALGLWDRLYVYRNPELRLSGVRWDVPAHGRKLLRHEALGPDQLEVFENPASAIGIA